MTCKNCGAKNSEQSKFCTSCGSVLKEEAVQQPKIAPVQPQSQYSYAPATSQYSYGSVRNEQPKGFGIASWIFTGILILKVLIILVTILMVVMSGSGADQVISTVFIFFTWSSVGSTFGIILTGFEILFATVFSIVQIIRNKSKFSIYCLVFAIIMSVLTVVLMFVYKGVVPPIIS